jgi:hypothetical protein
MYVSTVFRVLLLVVLVATICIQGMNMFFSSRIVSLCMAKSLTSFYRFGVGFVVFFTDSIFSSIVKWFRKPIVVEDYLKKYQTDNHKKYGWFVVTIVDAFVATRAAFVRSLVPKEKRY